VIIQAPRGTVADLTPYRPAFEITGADIYPVAYPPGQQAGRTNTDISLVGDLTKTMDEAAGAKAVWMTLQIAWSGTATTTTRPNVVPRFPSLFDERFMVYQAIVNGARGLVFFGGHFTQITRPRDAKAGWSWTFWNLVLKPLLLELTSTAVGPALVAPDAAGQVLFEYTQDPLPPPIGLGEQVFRTVAVSSGSFRDWFGPHDAHVYRFGL
jgi:hypothetical protein